MILLETYYLKLSYKVSQTESKQGALHFINAPYKISDRTFSKVISKVLKCWNVIDFFTLVNIVSYFARMLAIPHQDISDFNAKTWCSAALV